MQTPPEDAFDEIFRPFGGRTHLEEKPGPMEPSFIGGQLIRRARILVDVARTRYPHFFPKDIWVDLICNPRFNAMATSRADRDYVGFFNGTPIQVCYLLFDFLSHPAALPDVGSTDVETAHFEDLRQFTLWMPADHVRMTYCSKLLIHAFDFIASHELQHLFLGHTDYVHAMTGQTEFAEFGQGRLTVLTPRDYRALEWACDRAAIRQLYCSLRVECEQGQHADTYANLDEALRGMMLSIATVYNLSTFHESRQTSGHEPTHPHPQTRCILAAAAIREQAKMDGEAPEFVDRITDVLVRAHREAISTWNQFHTCGLRIEETGWRDDVAQMHEDNLRLQNELAQFCRYTPEMPSDWRELIDG